MYFGKKMRERNVGELQVGAGKVKAASLESSVFNLELAFLLPITGLSVIQGYLCITIVWVFFRKEKFVETIATLWSNFIELLYANLTLGTNSNYFTSSFFFKLSAFLSFSSKSQDMACEKSELVSRTIIMMRLENNLIQQTSLLYSNSYRYYVF